ncbi:MAG: hypothetical protein K6G64_03135 [Eubacterium sp.]|nr:hypothetical protein [Eubacterium sp.]
MNKKKVVSILLAVVMVFSLIPASHKTAEVKAASNKRVVGYFPSYRTYAINSIDYSAMTHCILSFMTYANGTLTSGFSGGDVQTIVNKCHSNGTKAMIAIGGWNGFDSSDNPFGTAAKRTSIVNQIMNYVDTYNLDGVDLDLEVNDANVWNNFDAFVSELSSRLKPKGKLLTMAVATWFTGPIANSTYNYFDFLNLMSYDYNQSGTGDVAPMSQIYDMVSYYGSRGVSNDRMVIGVPFYGYSTSGAVTYAEMVQANVANANLDYANGVHYNGMQTIRQKAEYSKNYGGTMIWEIGQDSFDSRYSLLQVIKSVMGTNNPIDQGTQPPATTKKQEVTTKAPEQTSGTWNSSTVYYGGDIVTYNGKTYKAQWWSQNNIPGQAEVWLLIGGTEEPTTKAPETTKPKETTTAAPKDGYTTAGANWTELNYWSPYFASGWGGDPTGAYKAGNSYSDFALKVTKAGDGGAWGIQLKTKEMSVTAGAQYRCNVTVQSNVAVNGIMFKEDKSTAAVSKNLSAGNNTIELNFTAEGTAQFVFDLAKAPTGAELKITSFALEKVVPETTTEAPTEAPTEATTEAPTQEPTTEKKTSVAIEINGCQVSATYEGFRVIYSASDEKNEIDTVGLVYGLEGYASDADMVVNSSNKTVYNYDTTLQGKLSTSFSKLPSAQSYAMTMKFVKSAKFYNTPIKVRAYAKLKNGEYVYTDIRSYVIYDVADYLYQKQLMSNAYGHNYLYQAILKICNPSYQQIDFKMDNSLVKF